MATAGTCQGHRVQLWRLLQPAVRRAQQRYTSQCLQRPALVAGLSLRAASAFAGTALGLADFTALQERSASRLHRFYVPQRLGPAPQPAAGSDDDVARLLSHSAASTSQPGLSHGPKTGSESKYQLPASVVLEGEEARHASRALRLQAGDRLQLCDGYGFVATGSIIMTDKQRVWVAPEPGSAQYHPWTGPRWVVAVACTTLKGGRAEWMVEKLTELGAFAVVPLVTERSQAGRQAKFRTRGSSAAAADDGEDGGEGYAPGRLERVAIAATKQSLRPHALRLLPPTPLAALLPVVQSAAGASLVAVAGAPPLGEALRGLRGLRRQEGGDARGGGGDAGSSSTDTSSSSSSSTASADTKGDLAGPAVLSSAHEQQQRHTRQDSHSNASDQQHPGGTRDDESALRLLLVGPEGDFTPSELAQLVGAGASPVGLGANRLRTETAAIGMLAACLLG